MTFHHSDRVSVCVQVQHCSRGIAAILAELLIVCESNNELE